VSILGEDTGAMGAFEGAEEVIVGTNEPSVVREDVVGEAVAGEAVGDDVGLAVGKVVGGTSGDAVGLAGLEEGLDDTDGALEAFAVGADEGAAEVIVGADEATVVGKAGVLAT